MNQVFRERRSCAPCRSTKTRRGRIHSPSNGRALEESAERDSSLDTCKSDETSEMWPKVLASGWQELHTISMIAEGVLDQLVVVAGSCHHTLSSSSKK